MAEWTGERGEEKEELRAAVDISPNGVTFATHLSFGAFCQNHHVFCAREHVMGNVSVNCSNRRVELCYC